VYSIENIFLEICPDRTKKLADAGEFKVIYLKRADFEHTAGFSQEKTVDFLRNYPLPKKSVLFYAIISG